MHSHNTNRFHNFTVFESSVRQHHKTWLAQKKPPAPEKMTEAKYTAQWILKECSLHDPSSELIPGLRLAYPELYASEIFHLFGFQTKSYIEIIDNKTYIASKVIPNFKTSASNMLEFRQALACNNNVGRFGVLLVLALYLGEMDFKDVGLDELKQIVKIDNDWCLRNTLFPSMSDVFTGRDIETLPDLELKGFKPVNLLDIIINNSNTGIKNSQTLFTPKIMNAFQNNVEFLAGKHDAMLALLLFDTDCINALLTKIIKLDDPIDYHRKILFNKIISRRDILLQAAKDYQPFRKYLHSDAAKETCQKFWSLLAANKKQIYAFKTEAMFLAQLEVLRNEISYFDFREFDKMFNKNFHHFFKPINDPTPTQNSTTTQLTPHNSHP